MLPPGDAFVTRAPGPVRNTLTSGRDPRCRDPRSWPPGGRTRRLVIVTFIVYRRCAMKIHPSPAIDGRDRLASQLRALAHPARLTVLETLARQNACMCGDIVRGLPLAQSTVSQHIKVLAEAGLVRAATTTAGGRPCYCIDKAALATLRGEIEALFEGLRESGCAPTATVPDPAASS